ncbi:MAG: TonB-dependent receptor [Candidatus Pseudobacter hemicellulosilyticus]|uniref:TonB-dependent receptor n=1 Tax=Candidatus Pseudobacter hemicellulosilyticus TaxID=3121375 RepID=A0AAJ6BFU5_9BACT|nr:MAG: TonB-dependent receptor [Pseudobacter sp.]
MKSRNQNPGAKKASFFVKRRLGCFATFFGCCLWAPAFSEMPNLTAPADNPIFSSADTVRPIKGTVLDDKGNPLAGASITIKNADGGASTDADGKFQLSVSSDRQVLVISFTGFQTRELMVGKQTELTISLQPGGNEMDQVIVVGYGAVKKSDLTGSVASVKGEKITQSSSGSFESLLQGRVSGLQVINPNNDNPQGGTTVRVRGVSSINGSNSPLVVIDGIPLGEAGNLNAVNPNIIASIEVLKDASATAIYGSRGANGVIMITTKRGANNRANVWFNQKTSFGLFSKPLDLWKDALRMATLEDEAMENAGLEPRYVGRRDASGIYYPSRQEIRTGAWPYYTDWTKYVFRKPSVTYDYNVGVEGGNRTNHYYVSLGYMKGEGMQIGDDYTRISLDLSYDHKVSDNLLVRTKAGLWKGKRNTNYGMNYARNPLFPVYNGDGSYFKAYDQDYGNPLAMTNERVNNAGNMDAYATVQMDWDIVKGLQLILRGNTRGGSGESYFFNPPIHTLGGDLYNGEGGMGSSNWLNFTTDAYLTYTQRFADKHQFSIMGGINYENTVSKGLNVVGQGFANVILKEENLAGADKQIINNSRSETTLASGFSRLNYTFNDRYLFTFTARADGSSKFGTDNKWGFFPSGAVSWKMEEEDFIRDLNFFDQLKLRASYGISGNQGISPYQSFSQFGQDYYYLNDKEYIIYGVGREVGREGIGNRYVTWGGMANNNLRWEKTAQLDIGIDLAFLDNRIALTADYYHKRTTDLLRQQFLNPSTGFDRVWTNDGKVENKGFEFSLDARIIDKGKWQFNAGVIFNMNRNKVLDIGSQESSGYITDASGNRYEPYGGGIFNDAYLNVLAIGQPINSFYGYRVDGIVQGKPQNTYKMNQPGELNYIGLKDDGTLDPNARTIIGDPNPDFTASLNLQLTHTSGFDFNVLFYGMYGNDIFATRKLDAPGLQEGRWTAEQPNNERPRLRADRQYFASSWFVEDGSFLRIQHITLGYRLPTSSIKFLDQGRVYLNVSNPVTWTRTHEFDPEVGENGRGAAAYPRITSITAGLEIKF